MAKMPTPEIAFEGVSPASVAAATLADMPATRASAAARENEPHTNLLFGISEPKKIGTYETYLVLLKIQSLVALPMTAPEQDT